MNQKKIIRRISATLIVLCILACCGFAQAASDKQQIEYYLLIDNATDETFMPQQMLPEILAGLTYLHPDYAEVSFQVYKIINSENPSAAKNQLEFLCTSKLTDHTSVDQLSETLYSIGRSPRSDTSRVTLDELFAEAAQKEAGRIIFIGSMTQKKVEGLLAYYVPLTQDVPYLIVNTKELKADAYTNYLSAHLNDAVTTVYQLYQNLSGSMFDQQLIVYHSTDAQMGFSISEQSSEVKVIASPGTYDGTKEPAFRGDNINLIALEKGQGQYKLDLEDNGAEKTIVTSELFDPFVLAPGEGLLEAYTMRDTMSVSGQIQKRAEETPDAFNADEWTVEITIRRDDGTNENFPPITPEADGTFHFEKDLRKITGNYTVFATARNSKRSWLNLQQEMGSFTVSNAAPTLLAEGTINRTIWKNGPISLENDLEIDLNTLFADDGYTEDIAFFLNEDAPEWVSIDGNHHLVINEEQIDSNATVLVHTTDAAGAASPELTVDIVYHNVNEMLKGATLKLTISGQEEDKTFHRDSIVKVDAVLTFPETAMLYLDELTKQEKGDQFAEQVSGIVVLDDEPAEVKLVQSADNPLVYSFGKEYQQLWKSPTDEHSIAVKATIGEAKEVIATAEEAFSITDQIPRIQADKYEKEYEKEVKGPWILYPDIPQAEREVVLPITKLVNTEIADIITVRVEGDESMKLIKKGDAYYFTNEEVPDAEEAKYILWDTTGEEKPELHLWNSEHINWETSLYVMDDNNNQAEGSPFVIRVSNKYHNEKLMIMIAMGIAAFIVLMILIAVIRQLRKPKFKDSDILQVTCKDYKSIIPLKSWGKKGITLLNVLRYSGAPIIGEITANKLEKIELKAGRKDKKLIIRKAKKARIPVRLDDSMQDSNKIILRAENKADIQLNDQETISLKMKDE